MKDSAKRNLVGLCRQCENEMFGTGVRDFGELPTDRRSVSCYSCGPIKVNQAGECAVKCDHGHNWSRWDRFIYWLSGATPKWLSE